MLNGPWSSLILRPAAIYGPGRGAHERIAAANTTRVKTSSAAFTSTISLRISKPRCCRCHRSVSRRRRGALHVAPDLRFLRHIVRYSAQDGGLPAKRGSANRRVDGSAIRRLLGITLRYPSYRTGIPASLAESARAAT